MQLLTVMKIKKHRVPGHILVLSLWLEPSISNASPSSGMKKSTTKLPIIIPVYRYPNQAFFSLKLSKNIQLYDKIPCFLSSFARSCNWWFLAKSRTGKVSFAAMRLLTASKESTPVRLRWQLIQIFWGTREESTPRGGPVRLHSATPQEGNGKGSPQTTLCKMACAMASSVWSFLEVRKFDFVVQRGEDGGNAGFEWEGLEG